MSDAVAGLSGNAGTAGVSPWVLASGESSAGTPSVEEPRAEPGFAASGIQAEPTPLPLASDVLARAREAESYAYERLVAGLHALVGQLASNGSAAPPEPGPASPAILRPAAQSALSPASKPSAPPPPPKAPAPPESRPSAPPPAPRRPTLRRGSRSEDVRDLQRRLAQRGIDPGPVDGIFGPRTERAVREFQRRAGIAVDGIVGPQTWGRLAGQSEVPEKKPPPAAGSPPPASGGSGPLLRRGARGEPVKALQRRLKELGSDPGAADGDFGPKTEAAVRDFQRRAGLEVDGVVGPKTWGRLRIKVSGPVQSPGSGPAPGNTAGGLAYPLPVRGTIIGRPYQGTHSRGNWQSDNAIDLSIPVGTPIYAAVDGVVGPQIGAFNSSNPALAGQRLTVEGGGNAFYYAHLSRLVVGAGQRVKKGQLLGYSGSANGAPHLHLGVRSGRADKLFGW